MSLPMEVFQDLESSSLAGSNSSSSSSSEGEEGEISRRRVLQKIESLAQSLVDTLDQFELPALQFVSPSPIGSIPVAHKYKRFTVQQSRSFASILLVLAYCHTLVLSNKKTTMREVYYFYVTHFRNQRECNTAIQDACELLQVPRHALGLQAASRGWFCGYLQLVSTAQSSRQQQQNEENDEDGDDDVEESQGGEIVWDGSLAQEGCPISADWLLPDSQRSIHLRASSVRVPTCVLVIEKEGIFQRLVQDGFWKDHNCILVTGKGFPDLATRAFVYKLYSQFGLPVFGLADCDPFGVLVLNMYSDTTTSTGNTNKYAVPLQWLGMRPSQVEHLTSELPNAVFQELTDLDQKKLDNMDENHPFVGQSQRRMDELDSMQACKVELEALNWLGMGFCGQFVGQLLDRHWAHTTHGEENDEDEMYWMDII